ncbi:histone promoter control protein 2-like [Teratosphaeria destructans]|uniref:Histone promoter control protein 2-like n=1 Tax=Teratosphaeria destructans TaxID=418781 RepID=A0A9W7SQD5_9PEZI|nr:histone promoter control protein 2-like [Teratosphaeria destructans]
MASLGQGTQADDGVSDSSLSEPISPPPQADTIVVADRSAFGHPQFSGLGEGVANPSSAVSAAHSKNGTATTTPSNGTPAAPEKPKRAPRKKKEVGPDGKPVDDGKPKKPRKPREPKVKTEGAATASTTVPRKRQKTDEKVSHDAPAPSRQPTITDMVNNYPGYKPIPGPSASPSLPPQPPRSQPSTTLSMSSNAPAQRPISSGQNYDPVRGGYDPVRAATMDVPPPMARLANTLSSQPSAQASPNVNRASASPSIASLIDPPILKYAPQTQMQQPFVSSQPQTTPSAPRSGPSYPQPPAPSFPASAMTSKPVSVVSLDGAMDVDPKCDAPSKPAVEIRAPSKSSSGAPTPKAKPAPAAPKATGSGLLSGHALFGGPSASEPEHVGVTIEIQIPLNPQGGNTINMAQEVMKKYGRDALNPRAAAHRQAIREMQIAQAKLEGAADDMSVDLMSDPGDDSNVEMGGMELDTTAEGKPRKRKPKREEYDKEDDFIDDTELAWEEQAAVAKDGFFVYSGLLIPPGETAQIESATSSGRGRGNRGRGRGSRGGAAAGTSHASLAEKNRDPTAAPARAKGRGRGTGAPRKPRITKADRERMEAEKMDRERTAQHIGGPTGAPIALAPTPPQQAPYGQPMTTGA